MECKMRLATEPYNKVASGIKKVESRIFDEKRQQLRIGDTIIFSENDHPENKTHTKIRGLPRYQTFKELFDDLEPELFGETSRDFLLKEIKQFYSDVEERKYGVVGIQFELIEARENAQK